VARGNDADLHLALQILDALDEIADRTHNTYYKIEILALRALALDARGQETRGQETPGETNSAIAAANAALKQAIDLARSGGFVRVFVDLGEPMQAMLRRLVSQDHSVETIKRILAACPADDKNWVGSQSLSRQPSLGTSTLAEPLTPRELEVLNLLRGPLSIKEIAGKLSISYGTAKGYTINVYSKLGVNRRWDAVAKAEELNILSPR